MIAQNNLLRTILLETLDRVKSLESKILTQAAPVPDGKKSFFVIFNHLKFPLNSMERVKELEKILEECNQFPRCSK